MKQDIYQTLKNRILFLEYSPGQILNEKELAKEFNVSRTPLRDVLNRLEWEQLVRILPRTGTMVTEIDFHKMLNIYQVRLEVESLTGRLAAEQASQSHLDQLSAVKRECEALTDLTDRKALALIDFRLREILHDAAGNPILKQMAQRLYHLSFRLWYSTIGKGEWEEDRQALTDEIGEIITTLSDHNVEEAGKVRRKYLRNHLGRFRNRFLGISG